MASDKQEIFPRAAKEAEPVFWGGKVSNRGLIILPSWVWQAFFIHQKRLIVYSSVIKTTLEGLLRNVWTSLPKQSQHCTTEVCLVMIGECFSDAVIYLLTFIRVRDITVKIKMCLEQEEIFTRGFVSSSSCLKSGHWPAVPQWFMSQTF